VWEWKVHAARLATIQQTMLGSVKQPTGLKTMTTADLESLADILCSMAEIVVTQWELMAKEEKLKT